MKNRLIFFLFLFCIVNYGCSQENVKKAQEFYKLANQSLMKEDLTSAINQIDSAIILDNTNVSYRILRGDIFCQSNQFDKGLIDLNYVLDQNSMVYEARNLRALANMVLGFTSKSKSDHIFLMKNYPDSIGSYIGLGMIYNKTQQWDSAIYYLNRGKEISQDSKGIYSQLAELYHLKKDYKKSIEILNESFNKNIISMEMLNLRGYNYILVEDYPKAKDDFKVILNSKLNDRLSLYTKAMAMNNMGFIEYKYKHFNEAMDWINKSLEGNPNNGFAYRNKALIFIELKDTKSTCENLIQANKLRNPSYDIDDLDFLMEKYCK